MRISAAQSFAAAEEVAAAAQLEAMTATLVFAAEELRGEAVESRVRIVMASFAATGGALRLRLGERRVRNRLEALLVELVGPAVAVLSAGETLRGGETERN